MNIVLFEIDECNGVLKRDDYRARHIIDVLKLKIGDSFTAGIINVDRGVASISLIDDEKILYSYQKKDEGNPLYPITLLVGQVRPISMKIIISGCDLTEKSYEKAKIWSELEYKQYLIDGAMQGGSSHVSEVELISSVKKVPLHADNLILLDNVMSSSPLSEQHLTGSVLVAIGPERGFSDKEREFFLNSGFSVHSIGNRILRTETACAVASALCLACMNYL
jgi:RsmE family RNA methyltransferase